MTTRRGCAGLGSPDNTISTGEFVLAVIIALAALAGVLTMVATS